MYYLEDNNDSDDGDTEEYNEFSQEIMAELKLDKKILIVKFYKELLIKEPEFVGINNICSAELLSIINSTIVPIKLTKQDHILFPEQIKIFDNMYNDLNIGNVSTAIYNTVTKKIFNRIYV